MNETNLAVKIIYSKRKTIAIELYPEHILVRAPKGMSKRAINTFLNDKRDWIQMHIRKMQERQAAIESMPPFTMDEIKEMADRAQIVLPEKVKKYAPIVGVDYGRITIRSQRTRWGSCSSKGNLNFNCLLMLFPEEVIDYVVVHELCHRKHMNHSADFYKEVARVVPDYRNSRKWLKERGGLYISRLP